MAVPPAAISAVAAVHFSSSGGNSTFQQRWQHFQTELSAHLLLVLPPHCLQLFSPCIEGSQASTCLSMHCYTAQAYVTNRLGEGAPQGRPHPQRCHALQDGIGVKRRRLVKVVLCSRQLPAVSACNSVRGMGCARTGGRLLVGCSRHCCGLIPPVEPLAHLHSHSVGCTHEACPTQARWREEWLGCSPTPAHVQPPASA